MNRPAFSLLHRPLHQWLLGLALLCLGAAAGAQQDPPGRVARLNLQQGTVSFAPAGEDSWYDAQPNRPITSGDRLWTDRNARAEVHIGSAALRMDGQTHVEFSELDDDTVRITANQGNLQLRVRDDLSGQRVEVDTGNLAVVIDAPGEYRIAADPSAGTTWVAVASGRATLHGENGQSQTLGARQQLTVSGRDLAAVNGFPPQNGGFDAWVAERNRIEDQSVSARYVSREVVGYQQLDNYGDWQNDPSYGAVWFPRNVDADWAPYRDGQWVNVAPWGLTWVDAAPWGFAPFHYGRWARVGPRWAWVPGQATARPVYSPALVGFVGGGSGGVNATLQIGDGRSGVGWFPLAPGEQWRPAYSASPRYIDRVNRMAAYRNRQAEMRNDFYANQRMPGAVTVVPADRFGRGPFGRRDLVRLPDDRFARVPVAPAPGIPMHGFGGGFGRPAAMQPPPQLRARQQQEFQYEQARQIQQMQQAQNVQAMQQRAAQQQAAQQQQQQQMEWQRQQGQRQQQEWQQRANQNQWQQQQHQQQLQLQQQQQAQRQQQELQQRAAQAQAQQMQVQQQQQRAAQQALAQQQMIRQQQEMQQRAVQMQQQALAQQQAQQNAMRQAQEAQVRAMQQQRGFAPPPQQAQPQPPPGQRGGSDERRRLRGSPDSQQP